MEEEGQIIWTAGFLNERFPTPVSPLGWSIVGPLFDNYALRDPLRFMGYPAAKVIKATEIVRGHPYANVLIFEILYNPFPDWIVPADAIRYFPRGDITLRKRAPFPRSLLNPRFVFSMLVHALTDPLNWSPLNFYQWERYTQLHDRRVAKMHSRLDDARTPAQIFEVIAAANDSHADLLKIHRWSLTYADLFYKGLSLVAGQAAQTLIADVPNLTFQADQALSSVSKLATRLGLSLDSDDQIGKALTHPEFERLVKAYVAAHGHRSFSLDIVDPTFREDPLQFLRLLPQATDRQAPERGQPTTEQPAVRVGLSPGRRLACYVLLPFARRYATLREDQRYYWHKSLAVTRRAYLMLAKFLNEQGVLGSANDIFYSTAEEVDAYFRGALDGKALTSSVRRRRDLWQQYWDEYARSPDLAYPAFLKGETALESESHPPRDAWQGRGVSPGHAHGLVRVILNARELSMVEDGEILVAPATDPGWTPVFARLAGLVVERGGVLAHSAIVAREHRLPAVAGIPNITRELSDGDWIEVDGTEGVVRRRPSS